MIIAFTGKAGSGKNTAASMVNYVLNGLTFEDWNKQIPEIDEPWCTRLLRKYKNKEYTPTDSENQVINHIKRYIESGDLKIFFEEKSFAGKMKDVCSLLTGIPREYWDDRELRNKELDIEDLKNPIIEDWDYNGNYKRNLDNYTYRTFMQRIGTEAMRGMVHQNIWVNALLKDYIWDGKSLTPGFIPSYNDPDNSNGYPNAEPIYPDWVITDLRFDNEALAIKERGGIIIKIDRPGVETIKHSSEVGIDKKYIDHTVFNHDGFEDLYDVLEWLLSDYLPNEQ